MPARIRSPLAALRRRLCEAAGIDRYSRPALHDIDRKLEAFLDFDGGYFVEAGANDGFTQSNTYYFERMRNWTGLLVEPVPELYERCRRRRNRSVVVRAALVSPDYPKPEVEMTYAGLMSVSIHAFRDAEQRRAHLADAMKLGLIEQPYTLQVPARTLSGILDEFGGGREVDLLSLDIEGAEMAALAGLDLQRHRPRFICVEAREPAAVAAMLGPDYEIAAELFRCDRYSDLLLRRR